MRLLSVNVGQAKALPGRPDVFSGISKSAASGPVHIGTLGVAGDSVVDTRYHGGPLKAVCACAAENYRHWNLVLNQQRTFGEFGDNFTIEGATEDAVCLGDVFSVGTVVLQVCSPRKPCWKLAAHWDVKDLAVLAEKQRRTGFYLRVLTPGEVSAGEDFLLKERSEPSWSIVRFWDLLDGIAMASPDEVQRLLATDYLGNYWKSCIEKSPSGVAAAANQ
jgi:MOSC domain-containing protein YiiM